MFFSRRCQENFPFRFAKEGILWYTDIIGGETVTDTEMARRIAERVAELGGRAYYVGGYVRDRLMKIESKDIDIEVHGITPASLASILDSLGKRMTIGESFGIYGLKGYTIDVAMPRKENLRGVGHRDFDVTVDPFIGVKGAARRRDFTVNALMEDVLTGEVIDSFGGLRDLRDGVLRHVSDESFGEDPLRVLRGAQFAARFGFKVADETLAIFGKMRLDALSKERVEGELEKALTKAEKPSVFFDVLRSADKLDDWFPELRDLIGIRQNEKYHAEGDAFTHTMMVLDAAAKSRENASDPFGFMIAALTHDFGKAVTTECIDGVIHSYGHETAGLPIAEKFLHRLTSNTHRTKYVLNLCRLHMKPNALASAGASVKSTNKMFDEAICPRDLILLARADVCGKKSEGGDGDNTEFLTERLEFFEEYMSRPFVSGEDLIKAGLAPGKDFSDVLAYAHKLRLAGVEKESALKQTLSYARRR